MLPQLPRHTQARSASSYWRRRFRRQLAVGRQSNRRKVFDAEPDETSRIGLEVLHRAAASCARQRAVTGLGKALRAGWGLPESGGVALHHRHARIWLC